MRLEWSQSKVQWLGQPPPERIDPPNWTRMEKLTAAGITLGFLSLLWSIYQRGR